MNAQMEITVRRSERLTHRLARPLNMPEPTSGTLTQAHLTRAEAIRKELDAFGTELSKVAPHTEAFFAVNRAWRAMVEAIKALKESLP